MLRCQKEKERMDCTKVYCPFALLIERSQMTPYHNKVLLLERFTNTDKVLGLQSRTTNKTTIYILLREDLASV